MPRQDPTGQDAASTTAGCRASWPRSPRKSQHLVGRFFDPAVGRGGDRHGEPAAIGAAFFEMTARMMSDPSRLVQAQLSLWNDYMTLVAAHRAAVSRRHRPSRWSSRRTATAAFATPRGTTTRSSTTSSRAIC